MNFGADANVLHCESYKRERVSTEDQSREKMPRGFYVLLSSKNDMTKAKLNIKTCPSCAGKRIKMVRRNRTGNFKGKEYTIPNLEYYECPDCLEKVYDREAMRQIQAHSPAFKRAASKRSRRRDYAGAATSMKS